MNVSTVANATSLDKDPITGLDMNRKTGNRTLGADDFMKILMTQLTAQDPMNPMKDTEFIAQMANFSSLEQMRSLSQSFTSYSNNQQMATAPLFLGKQVTITDPTGEVTGIVEAIKLKNNKPAIVVNGTTYETKLITSVSEPPTPAPPASTSTAPISATTTNQEVSI
jgi:flagellar basal-body rod modification protein FlgD